MNKDNKKWVLTGITAIGGTLGVTTEGTYAEEISIASTATTETLANQNVVTIPSNDQTYSLNEKNTLSESELSEEIIANSTFEADEAAYTYQSQSIYDSTSLSISASTTFSETDYSNASISNSETIGQSICGSNSVINQSNSISDNYSTSNSQSNFKQSEQTSILTSHSASISNSNSARISELDSQSTSVIASQNVRSSNLASQSSSISDSCSLRASELGSQSTSAIASQSARSSNLASQSSSISDSSSLRNSQIGSQSISISDSRSLRESQIDSQSTAVSTSQSYSLSTLASTSNSASRSQYKKNSTLNSLSTSASDSIWNANNNNADENLIPSIQLDTLGGSGYLFDEANGTSLYSFTDFHYTSPYLNYNPIDGYVKVPNLDTNSAFVNVWNGYKFSHAFYKGQVYQIGDRIYDEAFKDGNFEGLKFYFTPQEMTVKISYGIYSQSQAEIDAFNATLSTVNLPTSIQLKPGDLVKTPTSDIPGYKLTLKIIPTNIFPMPVPIDTPYHVVGTTYSSMVIYQYELIGG